jgi:hypothetical protein
MSLIEAHCGRGNGFRMYLLIAVTMGYLSATNGWVESQVRQSFGAGYANPILGRLSAFGGLASWACVLPAAYFYSTSDYDKNLWDALIFILCSFGGAMVAGLTKSRRLRYLLSPSVLLVNPAMVAAAYWMSAGS